MRRTPRLAASLLVVAGVAGAAEPGLAPSPTPTPAPAPRQVGGFGGAVFGQPERQVFIQGLIDLDWMQKTNYLDGDDDLKAGENRDGRVRAELGARIELDERIEAKLTLAYEAESGDSTWTGDAQSNSADEADRGYVVFDDAYVTLKEFLGQAGLSIKAGRQPVAWNLRTDFGAVIFDSRADDPDVTSWDGARGSFAFETLVFTPYVYDLPDRSSLFGIAIDWQPAQAEANGLFVTGSANFERHPTVYDPATAGDRTLASWNADSLADGKSRLTYTGGIEMRFENGLDTWFEGALQRGDVDSDIEYAGWMAEAGLDWHLRTVNQVVLGVQGDWLSGDKDPGDNKVRSFQRPWEGQQDTFIVEHEKYGEIGRFAERGGTGLRALKVKGEYGLDRANRFRLKSVYAWYQLDQAAASNRKDFGQEFDLSFAWQMNEANNATLSLLGGIFLPDDGYVDVAPTAGAGDDAIWLFGANLGVAF